MYVNRGTGSGLFQLTFRGSILDRMCSMCHYCGAGLTESKVDNKNQVNVGNLKLDSKVPRRPCKFCEEKLKQENVNWDSKSPHLTPLISPTTSLSSTDSCVSTCSKFLFLLFCIDIISIKLQFFSHLTEPFLQYLIFQVTIQLM